jgi:hypothetical protein
MDWLRWVNAAGCDRQNSSIGGASSGGRRKPGKGKKPTASTLLPALGREQRHVPTASRGVPMPTKGGQPVAEAHVVRREALEQEVDPGLSNPVGCLEAKKQNPERRRKRKQKTDWLFLYYAKVVNGNGRVGE